MTYAPALRHYLRWQVRDALTKAVVTPLLFLGVGGVPLWFLLNGNPPPGVQSVEAIHQMAVMVYTQALNLSMTLGALLLVSGVVSTDRSKQHFRFLFSRPVAPWQYYLQYVVVSVVLFVLFTLLVPLGFGFLVTPVPILAVAKSALVYALIFGGLAMLCSVLVDRDGLLLVIVALFSSTLQALAAADQLPRWAMVLADALPPFGTADALRTSWLDERSIAGGDVVLVVLYALGMLAASLVLIRRSPLAR